MEGDWSSREGRLPRLDREGRTLSDSDYCLPSPPERDLSTIHLSQVSLDGGYGGDVSSEAGSSEVFHHCQQPSYAHSEGYYSYVSSTDSITPFIDRLKRELEFTEVQENNVSNHGGSSVKWEESDTDTFVTPRDRTTNKVDCDTVWHFRGSSGDLVNSSSRTGLNNSSSRLSSPPLSSDSTRANYLSRGPLFHNASYESVNIEHATRLSSQAHVVNSHPTGVTHSSRSQPGHGCTSANSKATRIQANHCRSCDVAYTGRLPPLNLEQNEIPYSVRLHSNGSACDTSGSDRVQQSNNVIREHSSPRANKAQPQLSHSSRIQAIHSSNNDCNPSSNRVYPCDSTNHPSRINSNQNESPHHASRISSNSDTSHSSRHHPNLCDSSSLSSGVHSSHVDSSNHSSRAHPIHNESSIHSGRALSVHNESSSNHAGRTHSVHSESSNHNSRVHSVHSETTNHTTRAHSVLSEPANHKSGSHSSHGDPPNLSSRIHSIHNEPNHCHSNKIFTIGEPPNITHPNRIVPNLCDSSSNISSRMHSNHNDNCSMTNSSRGFSSRGSSGDFIGVSHLSRSQPSHNSSSETLNQDHLSRHAAKSTESGVSSHSSRMINHSNHNVSNDSSASHPTRIHSHSSISSDGSGNTVPSRINTHSNINSESSNSHSSRIHSHSSLSVSSESSISSHSSRIHSNVGHSNENSNPTSHSSRMHTHSSHTTTNEAGTTNHPTRAHAHVGASGESTSSNHPSRNPAGSNHSVSGESGNSNHSSRPHSHSSIGNESVNNTQSSRIHSHSSTANESSNTSLPSRIYSHSSHSVSSESANIARSSRVPPPQRHLSQSVLYLSADHRKLFPISTYQPEPPRVVGAVSVSERVVELENRLGGLKALQKKALLSFYQRHQASAPAPPPPPRRASSASDYLQLKGCIESSSIASGSSQGSNGNKEPVNAGNSCTTSTTSSNSLLKDARQLHSRSCGSLSGLSGPVIVGRSISVDDWVPARPPKGAHLRQAAPRPPSPEPPPAHTRSSSSGHTTSHQPSLQPVVSTPLSQGPEKASANHRPNHPSEPVRSGSHKNPPRAASPEPPPPPPSPPQQYSDEPLPPPPGPDELATPPSLPSRHPSPGPQVPIQHSDSYQRSQSSDVKTCTEPPVPSARNIANNGTKPCYLSEDLRASNTSLDIKPQKLSETSSQINNSNATELQLQSKISSKNVDKVTRSLIETNSQMPNDNWSKLTVARTEVLPDSTFKPVSVETDKREQNKRNSPLNNSKISNHSDSQLQFKTSSADLKEIEPLLRIHHDVQPAPSSPTSDSSSRSRNSPKSSSPISIPQSQHVGVKSSQDQLLAFPRKVSPNLETNLDQEPFNQSAIDPVTDVPIQQSPPKALTRNITRDNLSQPKPVDKILKNEDVIEESQTHESKKIIRRTSFRCSERIQQSITTLQNSIRSSSPQKHQESQKEMLYKDLLAKDILPKDLLKDILSKDPLAKEIFSSELDKDIIAQDISKQSLPKESKDSPSSDVLPKDSAVMEMVSKESLTKISNNNDKYSKDLVAKDILTNETFSKEISKNGISEERWISSVISEAAPSKISLSLTRLDHIDITEKLLSSFTSQKCIGVDEKEDIKLEHLSDSDLEKSCSLSSQLDSSISVGSLQQKKEELVTRLSRKLSVLRAEAAAVAEETSANEELGEAVVERVSSAWGAREASRLRSHVADLGRLTALLLTLTTRLARADNALLALSSCHPDKGGLETKRDRLAGQLEEARRLKEKVDRRNEAVTTKLRERLTPDEFSDFMHFVSLKSKLLLDSREIADKIKLGEEQLQALQMTLSAVT